MEIVSPFCCAAALDPGSFLKKEQGATTSLLAFTTKQFVVGFTRHEMFSSLLSRFQLRSKGTLRLSIRDKPSVLQRKRANAAGES